MIIFCVTAVLPVCRRQKYTPLGSACPRSIAMASGNQVAFLDHAGRFRASAYSVEIPFGMATQPCAIGDADLDGDPEIAVPLADSTMHLLDDTGAEPALASAAWKVHLVDRNGVQMAGFPVKPSIGWFLYASRVIEQIDSFLPDITIGTRGSEGWALNVAGGTVDGWPRGLGAHCERTPAVADIDQDGFNELVLLTTADVQVFDTRTAPFGAPFSWPMAGHDAQRTGCSDCAEDQWIFWRLRRVCCRPDRPRPVPPAPGSASAGSRNRPSD